MRRRVGRRRPFDSSGQPSQDGLVVRPARMALELDAQSVLLSKEGAMSSVQPLIDAAGRRRSPAAMPGFRTGIAPGNKGQRYPADPPTVEEIIAVMREAQQARYGHRLN